MSRARSTTLETLGEDVLDLLVRRSCTGVSEMEAVELVEACEGAGVSVDAFDEAIAALVTIAAREPMPAEVRERLEATAARVTPSGGISLGALPGGGGADGADPNARGPDRSASTRRIWGGMGWFAAAAGVALAGVMWILGPSVGPDSSGRANDVVARVDSSSDAVRLPWGDWDAPEVAGVRGEVVWSDAAQAGYMRFTGLPDAGRDAQYQLWIIDAERGMEQRISGGVFDARASAAGEVVVAIEPRLFVNRAAAFAVTIEKPGGTWVSDMSRRVVIASRG